MKLFDSIKNRIIGMLFILALALLITLTISLMVIDSQKTDSLLINIAGRQRMLCQKIAKETLTYISADYADKIKKEEIEKSIKLFTISLNALIDGGETFTDLQMQNPVTISGIEDAASKEQLLKVREIRNACKNDLEAIIETKGSNKKQVEGLLKNNMDILRNMHIAVGLLQKYSERKTTFMKTANITGFLVILTIGIFLFFLIMNKLARPVEKMIKKFEIIASGDLTEKLEVKGKDEISQVGLWVNTIITNMRNIIQNVKEATAQVVNTSDEITAGSDELSSRTNDQAASITETSTTIEEFTSILKTSSTNSEDANSTLMEFNKEVQSKQGLMKNVTETMNEINSSSKKIDEIVSVINDISFQTNLLALNAAVEAARAGEAGRGFAVVASEVRSLAGKTADSSKTIQDIVSSNVESTTRGMDLIKQTTDFFNTLVTMTQDIVSKIEQIANGSKEQFTGVEQINIAINQLENVINQNAALVEELSSTSRSMRSNAIDLSELVAKFRIDTSDPDISNSNTEEKSTASPKKKKIPVPPTTHKNDEKSDDDFFNKDEEGFEEF